MLLPTNDRVLGGVGEQLVNASAAIPAHHIYSTISSLSSLFSPIVFVRSSLMLWKSKLSLFYAVAFAQSTFNVYDSAYASAEASGSSYLLGVGIGDVTGPITETNSGPHMPLQYLKDL